MKSPFTILHLMVLVTGVGLGASIRELFLQPEPGWSYYQRDETHHVVAVNGPYVLMSSPGAMLTCVEVMAGGCAKSGCQAHLVVSRR